MAGLPWYAIASDFSTHRKTLELCERLGDRNAGMYVVRLFEHCSMHALDGKVRAAAVEEIARWRGRRGSLRHALLSAGVLEAGDGETMRVHGWWERNGARIEKALRDNARPNAKYRHPAKTPRGVSAGPRAGPRENPAKTPPKPRAGDLQLHGDGEREEQKQLAKLAEPTRAEGVERLRRDLAAALDLDALPVSLDAAKHAETVAAIAHHIERLGYETALASSIEIANEIAPARGDEVLCLAYLPGWLKTVKPRRSRRNGAAGAEQRTH